MPVSADLLKALADDPKALEQQLGCMTGLFQIFDRQGLGRRYGSKRVSNAASGQSQPTSACETPRHDHRSNNPYWMFEDDASQRMSSDSFGGAKKGTVEGITTTTREHHRAYSDSSEIFTKSFETPTESRTSPDEKSLERDHSPMYSEDSVSAGLAFYYHDAAPAFDPHHDLILNAERSKKLNVVVPARANSSAKDSSHIRNIVRASFDRDHPQRSTRALEFINTTTTTTTKDKEKPRLSVDGNWNQHNHLNQGAYLKNLPRSASVDHGRDRLRFAADNVAPPPRQTPVDLPRSTSVGGRGASRILSDWKDGLRSPRLSRKEKEILKQNIIANHQSNPPNPPVDHCRKLQNLSEAREPTRLTVELKEGPRLSVEKPQVATSPRPVSRHRDHNAPCEVMPSTTTDLTSLRSADIKDFLRGSQKGVAREGHRYSVDSIRDAPRASTAPRLSVDGREYSSGSSTLVARKLKLDRRESGNEAGREFVRQSSGRGNGEGEEGRRKVSNVVARLMGLDELPNVKDHQDSDPLLQPKGGRGAKEITDSIHELNLHFGGAISPPPPPSPPDYYDYAHGASNHDVLRHWQKRVGAQRVGRGEEEGDSIHQARFVTPTKLQFEHPAKDMSTPEDRVISVGRAAVEEDRERKVEQPQVQRKSPQGRRSLWHIFEAMQLKGLLNGSSKRKQAEALRLHNLKMEEEKESEELKKRSQSLPPRLSPASKDLHSGGDFQDTPRVLSLPVNRESVYSRAMPEHKPVSGLDQQRRASDLISDEDDSRVMVKPIITRSMSYKSQATAVAAAPSPPSATLSNNPDIEDALSTSVSRAMSKSVAYHRATVKEIPQAEPLQPAESLCSHNASSSASALRQARRERGAARMTKSFSDVPQSERDFSPRGPRAYMNTQEKPTRSCSPRGDSSLVSPRCPRGDSSSVSPRCPRGDSSISVSPRCPGSVEGMRPMDAGKVRRKQAIAVKDREETKASLANLRANATKQEFLKGRASGDPDTPRLLRRSSSESKLLSKIAEKPITTDNIHATKPPAGGRSTSPNVALLRSKRPPVSKDNKSPLKTRPASTPSVKSVARLSSPKETVAVEHVNRPKAVYPAELESSSTVAQRQQPAENKPSAGVQASPRCSMTEVRATQGGALDHSGDTTHSDAREQRTESKAREKNIEIEEGVKTPRGVSIKKIDYSEDAQAEVAEQPSPVSVLDNSHFDEELTPSPKASKSSVVSPQEQSRNEKDRRWNSARFLALDLEDSTSSTALLQVPELVKEEIDSAISSVETHAKTPEKASPVVEVHPFKDTAHRHSLRVCLKDADEERTYVEELVEASSLGSGCSPPDLLISSSHYVMDPSVFDQLETKRSQFETSDDEKDALDRRILFDCVNEVLERLLETQVSCMRWTGLLQPSLRKRPMGRQLVEEVLVELEDIPCVVSEDVCDTVYVILQKDLVKGRSQQWSHYNKELQEVGVAVERMIVKDLIEETVRELNGCFGRNPLVEGGASRRQLFA